MASWETFVHLFAGGMGGTMGAIVTCPLEVVKTRLQSSHSGFELRVPPLAAETRGQASVTCRSVQQRSQSSRFCTGATRHEHVTLAGPGCEPPRAVGLVRCIRIIIEKEGPYALWKGLGPNLVGVAPSRAIYFCSYSNAKKFFNRRLKPESPVVHMASAICAGFCSCTATNPIWLIKTRLQLDQHQFGQRLRVTDCIRQVYAEKGIRGFYKGITASYFGITETMIHFVIYEHVKRQLQAYRGGADAAARGGYQVPALLPDVARGVVRGGPPRPVPRPGHTAGQTDTQHGHHDVHLRDRRVPAQRSVGRGRRTVRGGRGAGPRLPAGRLSARHLRIAAPLPRLVALCATRA